MSSFQAKIGWKRPRMCQNKSYHSVSLLPDSKYKISKKIEKKFKIQNNTVMATFEAKIGWKRMPKRENKNYRPVSFLPDA